MRNLGDLKKIYASYENWKIKITWPQFVVMLIKAILVSIAIYVFPRAIFGIIGGIIRVDFMQIPAIQYIDVIVYYLAQIIGVTWITYICVKHN